MAITMRYASALLTVAILMMVAPQVAAHSEPFESSPACQERLTKSPTEVTVSFTESIHEEGSWIQVWDLSGNRVDDDELIVTPGTNPTMSVGVAVLSSGPYQVIWQTYSPSDGHVLRGTFGFTVGAFTSPAGGCTFEETPTGVGFARALVFSGYSLAFGALAFHFFVMRREPNPAPRMVLLGATTVGALAHFAGVIWLVVDTAVQAGLSPEALLVSVGGRELWLRAIGAFGLLFFTIAWQFGPVRPRAGPMLLFIFWALTILTDSRFGHSQLTNAWLLQTIHATSIAIWVGGLVALAATGTIATVVPSTTLDLRSIGRRFSTVAIVAVAAMLLTGLALSLSIAGSSFFDIRLWNDTPWRLFLSFKVLLVLVMILLAIFARIWLRGEDSNRARPGFVRRAGGATMRAIGRTPRKFTGRDFRNFVAVEAIVGVVVIVFAGMLMSVGAPKEIPQEPTEVYVVDGKGTNFTAEFTITPGPQVGHLSDVQVLIQHKDGRIFGPEHCANSEEDRNINCVVLQWWPVRVNTTGAPEVVGIGQTNNTWLFEQVNFVRPRDYVLRLTIETLNFGSDAIQITIPVANEE